MNHLFKLQEGSYNALRMFQTILKSIFDLASVGSVTVSCASHPVHVPTIWIASGMESEKRGYFQFQIFNLFSHRRQQCPVSLLRQIV